MSDKVKKITITISAYVHDKYLSEHIQNKSRYIEEMFVRGIEAARSEIEDYSAKYFNVLKELRTKDDENKKLKAELGRLKANNNSQKTLNNLYTEEELTQFKEKLDNNSKLKDFFTNTINLIKKDPIFERGQFKTYKCEYNFKADYETYNLFMKMAAELKSRGEL